MRKTMDEKILQYLEGELSESEKKDFEKGLLSSPELKMKYDEFLSVKSKINDLKNIEIDNTYFNGIIPEFRNRVEVKKKAKKIFSFSFANSLIAIILLYFVLKPGSNTLNLNEAVKKWTDSDFNYAIEYVNQQYTGFDISDTYNLSDIDSVISTMLTNELNLSNNYNTDQIIDNSLDYNNIKSQINIYESENIYSKILNKKYF